MRPVQIVTNERWEKFAQFIASGETGASAYRPCYGARGASAAANASRLLRNDTVRLRVAELRAAATAAAAEREAAAAEHAAQQLTTTLLTMQRRREIAREIAEDAKQRASDRLAAVLADAKLAGELNPETVAVASVSVQIQLAEDERAQIMAAKQQAIGARKEQMRLEQEQESAARN